MASITKLTYASIMASGVLRWGGNSTRGPISIGWFKFDESVGP